MSEPLQHEGSLIIVSAPSGGGKTSLTRALVPWLAERGIAASISVSYTTRAPRPGEVDGVHYHFVDIPRFKAMIAEGQFLEYAEVFGRFYGTGRERTEAMLKDGCDVILDIDWQGARQVRERSPDAISVFIVPPSITQLDARLRGRGQDSDEVIAGRMAEARAETAHYGEYDFLIVNDRFDLALEQMGAIVISQRLRLVRQRQRHASLLAELLAPGATIR